MQIKRRPVKNIKCCYAIDNRPSGNNCWLWGSWELVCKYYKAAAASASLETSVCTWGESFISGPKKQRTRTSIACALLFRLIQLVCSPSMRAEAKVLGLARWIVSHRVRLRTWLYFYTLCFLTSDSKRKWCKLTAKLPNTLDADEVAKNTVEMFSHL